MDERRRALTGSGTSWELLCSAGIDYNNSSGGYNYVTYIWTNVSRSDFVGSSSKYVIIPQEYYYGEEEYEAVIEVSDRNGVAPNNLQIYATTSPTTPPSEEASGESWIVIASEMVLQSNGWNASNLSDTTVDGINAYYLTENKMATVVFTWNYYPSEGGSGTSGECLWCGGGPMTSSVGFYQSCPNCKIDNLIPVKKCNNCGNYSAYNTTCSNCGTVYGEGAIS